VLVCVCVWLSAWLSLSGWRWGGVGAALGGRGREEATHMKGVGENEEKRATRGVELRDVAECERGQTG
jgi:hypothetical protein